ncbi:MAG: hydrogen gas-evolving membrane-bound hydrogenase subunit E [Lachnospiraceae bacterium]
MSKLKSEKEYQRTKAFHFFRWLNGTKDPFIDTIEMKVQEEVPKENLPIEQRMREEQMLIEKVYDIEKNKEMKIFNRFYVVMSIIFCITFITVLLMTVSYLPETGNPANPTNNEVSARYIEQGMQETGTVNIVTGMILNYRAFDTFGETCVLFIATSCVMILLMVSEDKLKEEQVRNDRRYEPKNDIILQKIAFVLVPIIFIFGIYVILNGHLSPGGGFSGGAMIGAGLILYLSAFGFEKTERFFNEPVYKTIKVGALTLYGFIMIYYFYTGANGIHNIIPLGQPGDILSSGMILPINIFVGLEVACTMYVFYALFRRGGL